MTCDAPCAACPWGPLRVGAALARLPRVALRHWVLVPPTRWARALGSDADAAQRFRRAVVGRVVGDIERAARAQLGHARGRAGAVAVLHAVGSDLRPRAHVHVIATDGVFVPADRGPASFVALAQTLAEPALRELARVVGAEARNVLPQPPFARVEPSGVRVRGDAAAPVRAGTVVQARGTEVFVGTRVEAHDRRAAERLAAYVTRPPLSPGAVRSVGGGDVQLALREPSGDGAVALRLPEAVFEQRVQAMVASGAGQRMSVHGVLAPGSAVRWRGDGVQLRLVDTERAVRRERAEVERCGCGGRLEVVAVEPDRRHG